MHQHVSDIDLSVHGPSTTAGIHASACLPYLALDLVLCTSSQAAAAAAGMPTPGVGIPNRMRGALVCHLSAGLTLRRNLHAEVAGQLA